MILLCSAKLSLKFPERLESNMADFIKVEIYNHGYKINLHENLDSQMITLKKKVSEIIKKDNVVSLSSVLFFSFTSQVLYCTVHADCSTVYRLYLFTEPLQIMLTCFFTIIN